MRVMVLVKATDDSERGILPTTEMFEAMGKYNEELINAGIMRAGDGLKPSSQGRRIAFDGPSRTVIDGPFNEARELVAGFWLWEVKDMEEAVAWVSQSHARTERDRNPARWLICVGTSHRAPKKTALYAPSQTRSKRSCSSATIVSIPDDVLDR
jgi:hypothetical protein